MDLVYCPDTIIWKKVWNMSQSVYKVFYQETAETKDMFDNIIYGDEEGSTWI